MKAVRIILRQSSANYRKEETMLNKMTYPLPPLSTIIGALHNACGYREYKEMDISVQGKFGSMHKEPYTDYCFLNSVQDDRGILVKMRNGTMLSTTFDKVAEAKKSQGNSFRNNITIQVHNQQLLDEYRSLKDLNDELAAFKKGRLACILLMVKTRKQTLAAKKKMLHKDDVLYTQVSAREKEIKEFEKELKNKVEEYERENYTKPISNFRSLTTSLKYYEILNDIELIIHVKAQDNVLQDIVEHINNLKSIGRSEDMVDVQEAVIVDLIESNCCSVMSSYSAYVSYEQIEKEEVFALNAKANRLCNGTKYYLNKNYEIIGGKRTFHKKKVMYISGYEIEKTSETVFLDKDEKYEFIVNFI